MKYIHADKLIAEIERLKSVLTDPLCGQGNILGPDWVAGGNKMLNEISSVITSLQQEQPVLPGIEDPGIPGKDFIPVEWVDACEMYGKWKIVKQKQPEFPTTDEEVEKALASIPKVELPDKYKTTDWLFKQPEQPEVELEKEIKDTCREYRINESHEQELGKRDIENIARHFYELGLNARKK